MSDLYHSLANSNIGRKILSSVNLPTPVVLERWKEGQTAFIQGKVILSAAEGGTLINEAAEILKDCELSIQNTSFSSTAPSATEKPLNEEQGEKFKALVFDASGISNTQQLTTLHTFFHPLVRSVENNGRIIVLGKPPEDCQEPSQSTAQRALEGFTRSLSKELGKKGITTQLIYVKEGAEKQLASPLRFCLSPKSAFVSAQVIRVSNAEAVSSDFDWQLPLKNKVALVTGASRGIGEAIAETLARDGATIIGLDVPQAQEELEVVMKRLNGHSLLLDITSETAPEEITQYLQEKFSGVDIVVHNAGITRDKTLGGMPEHLWNLVIDINLSAMERINAKLIESNVINKNGRIVAVSSMSGIAGNFGQTNYAVSKAGVIGYVQSMAAILNEQGITINAVAPGFIETQMTAAIPFTIREAGRRLNALSQGGLPVDVAETIAFFASGASKGINGNTIRVCGQNLLGA
jgi:3-oxoacyl-[acyl-carrier protein] reductase